MLDDLVCKSFKDGYATLASLCAKLHIHGYQIRPKEHMMTHIVSLGLTLYFCIFMW